MIEVNSRLSIIELRAQGYSIQKIAKKLDVAKQTVVDTIKANKEEVASLHAIQLDALYEAEKVTAEARIKNLSTLLKKIQQEIDSRDLSDVPTDKLIDLYIKTSSTLDGVMIEPAFKSSQELREEKEAREALARLVGSDESSTKVVRKMVI